MLVVLRMVSISTVVLIVSVLFMNIAQNLGGMWVIPLIPEKVSTSKLDEIDIISIIIHSSRKVASLLNYFASELHPA